MEMKVFVLIRPENFPRLKREKKSSTIGIGFHFLCCFGRWLNIIKKEEKNEEAYFFGFGG